MVTGSKCLQTSDDSNLPSVVYTPRGVFTARKVVCFYEIDAYYKSIVFYDDKLNNKLCKAPQFIEYNALTFL